MKIEEAVLLVKKTPENERRELLEKLLHGRVNHETPVGQTLASQRAIFCSRLSSERLWPER